MQDAEAAIAKGGIPGLQQQVNAALATLAALDLRGRRLAHLKAASLVLDLIHHRDVADALAAANTTRTSDWQWTQQLRYYMHSNGVFCARMLLSQFLGVVLQLHSSSVWATLDLACCVRGKAVLWWQRSVRRSLPCRWLSEGVCTHGARRV